MSRSADTAEIPAVKQAVVAGGKPYAETMNFELVMSRTQCPVRTARRLPKSAHLMGAASIAVIAAGASIGLPLLPSGLPNAERAVAAVTADDADPAEDVMIAANTLAFDVTVDGSTTSITAQSDDTYAAAFAAADITINPRDEVSVSLSDIVTTQPVTIVRVTTDTVVEEYTESFQTERVDDATLPVGEEKVKTAGVDGTGMRNYQVTYRDGEESSRTLLIETLNEQPVTEVILVGTKDVAQTPVESDMTNNAAASSTPPTGSSSTSATPVPAGSPREIAQGMLSSYGWGMDQWSCLDSLWQRESNWNYQAANGSSGAYGIPQALPGSKMASAGADWATNPATQIKWGLSYIAGRYGSPCNAWAHSQSVGWY